MSPAERAGQVVMVGITRGSRAEMQVLKKHAIGTVILMGDHDSGVAGVKPITARLAWKGQPTPILVATDQEGGMVQRLKGAGFTSIPSARIQANWSNTELTAQARSWGNELKKAGVRWTLAPVADVVPAPMRARNAPIGALDRGYGAKPAVVAAKVKAFTDGMHAAGVATSVKHFPGIGQVQGNTDFSHGVKDRSTTADDAVLQAFEAGLQRPRSSVMMSTVTYTRIDPDNPAAFSAKVIALLHRQLGFDGVVISDDLGAAAAVASVPARQRGVRFIKAGGSLAMTVDASLADEFVEGLQAAQKNDRQLAAQVTRAATRVVALKVELGLVPCR